MTPTSLSQQRGFTMVELLVALVISLMIALAAISALTVTRQGFTTVDSSSQLRDNGRFASDLIQRIAVQSGFKDVFYATQPPTPTEIALNIAPNITGFNNATSNISHPLSSATTRTAGTDGYGSDVLILQYQTAKLNADPNSTLSDKSMIDCMGNPSLSAPSSRTERMANILHLAVSQGELSLMCSTVDATGNISGPQPIIQGVEAFQVLYGTDGVTAGTASPAKTGASDHTTDATYAPNRYLRADQMTVTGTGGAVATNDNWRRVRSLRIGMVLRGPANSSQEKVAQTLYPFGKGASSASGAAGSALSSAEDPGTVFSAPADGRLRQVVTFTVQLRNDQSL